MQVEKRNLRPYVLSFCFFWGLVLGFAVYSTSQSTAEITEKEQKIAQAAEAARLKKIAEQNAKKNAAPTENTKKVGADVKPPIVVADLPAEQLKSEEDEVRTAAQSRDWRSIPQASKVRLNPAYGLTARTSPLPLPPERLNLREIRRRNARTTATLRNPTPQPARPAATPSPDLPMPEIE